MSTPPVSDIAERRTVAAEREQLLEELRQAQAQLRAELEAMTRLQRLGSLYVREGNIEPVLAEIVEAAIAISGADFGNIQLLDEKSSDLRIVAHRGFPAWWLEFWNTVAVGHGVCGTALERGERVIVEDVEHSPIFIGTPALEIQLKAGVRAVQSTPLVSRSGRPLGMFSTHYRKPGRPDEHSLRLLDLLARHAADIIARTQAEEALRKAKEELEASAVRTNEFLAMLSHELRNPLTPIRNSLFVLDRAEPGGEQARRALSIIERQVGTITRLVDDLLDVTRIARGKAQLRRERVDICTLASRTLEDHRAGLIDAGLEVHLSTEPGELWLEGDPTRLVQIISNLLGNAAKFTPSGGSVTVSVHPDAARRHAIIRVQDTGRGITPEILPHLFEAFTQADEAIDRSKGGLGLGLALVRGLVEMHGGTVSAASDGPDQGATFTVTLPLERDDRAG